MKLYSKAEKSSLAYYLKECKLDNKLDMPFHRMFKYYGRALKETNAATAEQMREVAEYCIIDAISCQPNFNNKLFIREVEIVKREQSKHFREVGKKVMDESMRLDNTRTLRQIVKDVLKETINDILQIDLNGVIKTAVWKSDKNNKSVQCFISRMRDRHTREEADAKRLIKKGLTPEPYLYEIPEPGERFEYIVVENDLSQRVGDKMEYPEVVR